MRRPLADALLSLLLCSVVCGCNSDPGKGYTFASPHREGIESIAIPMWTRSRNVYRREIEIRLTEAIIKRIELDTPYKVTTKDRADTMLTGTLEGISQRPMSVDPNTGRTREQEVIVTVSFRWSDLRTGEVLLDRERKMIRAPGVYIPLAPFGEDFSQGCEEAINEAARRVVETLEADW